MMMLPTGIISDEDDPNEVMVDMEEKSCSFCFEDSNGAVHLCKTCRLFVCVQCIGECCGADEDCDASSSSSEDEEEEIVVEWCYASEDVDDEDESNVITPKVNLSHPRWSNVKPGMHPPGAIARRRNSKHLGGSRRGELTLMSLLSTSTNTPPSPAPFTTSSQPLPPPPPSYRFLRLPPPPSLVQLPSTFKEVKNDEGQQSTSGGQQQRAGSRAERKLEHWPCIRERGNGISVFDDESTEEESFGWLSPVATTKAHTGHCTTTTAASSWKCVRVPSDQRRGSVGSLPLSASSSSSGVTLEDLSIGGGDIIVMAEDPSSSTSSTADAV